MKGAEKEARRWFLQAEDDLRCVEWLWKEERFLDKGCFISQQAGEKALKACLYSRGERRALGILFLRWYKIFPILKRPLVPLSMKPEDWTDFIPQHVILMQYQEALPFRFILLMI